MSETAYIVLAIVIVAIVLVLAVYVWLWLRKRRQLAAMSPEERELYQAQKHYDEAIALAEKTLDTTEDAWNKRVKSAEEAVADAHRIGSRPLGSYEKIRLFEDYIEAPQGAFRFENGVVEATVDTARSLVGTRGSVLSRAGGEVFQELVSRSSKPEGMHVPYLLVETPIFVSVVQSSPDDEAKARQFALSVNTAAASVAGHKENREQALARAQAELDRVRAEKEAAVKAAQAELGAVKANTERLDAARKAVESARARSASPG